LFNVHENCFKLRKMKYKLFNNLIWRNITYTFYLITINLNPPTVGQNCMQLCKLSNNDNESKIEIFIKTKYQFNMKITITVPKINLYSISPSPLHNY